MMYFVDIENDKLCLWLYVIDCCKKFLGFVCMVLVSNFSLFRVDILGKIGFKSFK